MRLTEYAVRHYQFTIVVFLCVAALGVTSFLGIQRTEDPPLEVPSFSVIVVQPGAGPEDLERLVARPIEDALKELNDIDTLTSTILDGLAVVTVEFDFGVDPDRKNDDVLRQVAGVRPRLPADVVSIEVRRFRTINVAFAQVALVSADASYARLQDLAEALRKRLEAVPGVRRAEKWAYPEKQVRVDLDLDRLQALRIPLGRVAGAVQGANINLPAGAVEAGDRRFSLKTSGLYESLDDIRATIIGGDGRSVVRLGDVAEVSWSYEELDYFGRFNRERAVFVTALPQEDVNLLAVRPGVDRALEAFSAELPGDVRLERGYDQTRNISQRLDRLEWDFLFAFALVLVTVLPLGFRASLLVLISIPLSLALGITALGATGFTLNQLSIVGCVIALGLLVDDSIVVVENIARFRRLGYPPAEAAVRATNQIAVAVIGTTATLVFAFVPLLSLPAAAGAFIRSLPIAVVYTVVASLLVALTIIPFLASRMLTGREDPEGNAILRLLQRGIERGYRPLLHWAMAHPRLTVAAAAILFLASLGLVPAIGFSLFPKAGTPQFAVRVTAAEGSSVAATDAMVRAVEERLAGRPEVRWMFASVGRDNPQIYYNEIPRNRKANRGEIFVEVAGVEERDMGPYLDRLRADLASIPGGLIVVKEFENGPPIEAPIAVRLFAEDLEVLARLAARTEDTLRALAGTRDVDNPVRVARTDLRLRVDREALGLLGVAEADLDRAVRLGFAGLEVARFREADGDEYAITLGQSRGPRSTLDSWAGLRVPTEAGDWVPLAQVAKLELESAPPQIQRYNRERVATVTAYVQDGYVTDRVTRALEAELRAQDWPAGTRFAFGGEVESREESFGGIGTAVVVAVAGILAILVLEFGTFRGTLIVASVVPLGVIGGLLGLWLTGNTLSFTAAIGFVALIGIEIKNSILLVDFTNQLRREGVGLREAIERAGSIRFLPVVLTTLTALGALTPLALQGAGLYSPLAIVIMGGLISSLLLSRLVTPVMYLLLPPPAPEPLADQPGDALPGGAPASAT